MIQFFFDGLSEPNPGLGTFGYVAKRNGEVLASGKGLVGEKVTNNQAEYSALLAGLEALIKRELADEPVIVCGDSKLVLNQMSGRWRVNSPRLLPLYQQADLLARCFMDITWRWVPREDNEEADALSRQAFIEKTGQDPNDVVPTCPECTARMVRRRNRRDGNEFWGCLKYPDCRGTRNG